MRPGRSSSASKMARGHTRMRFSLRRESKPRGCSRCLRGAPLSTNAWTMWPGSTASALHFAAFSLFYFKTWRVSHRFIRRRSTSASADTASRALCRLTATASVLLKYGIYISIFKHCIGFFKTQRCGSNHFLHAVVETQAFCAFVSDVAVVSLPQIGLSSPFISRFVSCLPLVQDPDARKVRVFDIYSGKSGG